MKARATAGGADCPQPTAVRFNDRAADAQPHPGAVRLRGEERFEYPVRELGEKSGAIVADRDDDLRVVRPLRLDHYLSRPVHVFHGIDAVDDEVHDDLLQLYAIPGYP